MSKNSGPKNDWIDAVPPAIIIVGVVLIATSFLPLARMTDHYWTEEDSAAYDRVSLEYHRAAYESPVESGRSEAELQAYRERLQERYEALRNKLEDAGSQPERWRRILLWLGGIIAAGGVSSYFIRQASR